MWEFEFEDGEETHGFEWDLPDWEDTDNDEIYYLSRKYQNGEGIHLKGYYLDGNLQEYLGNNFEDAVAEIN